MNKITLKSPLGTVYSTKDFQTARTLIAQGWTPVQATVTKVEAKK